jgi:type I restriction enzyme S subunit
MSRDYKRLGDYIQPVIGRNNDLGDLPLMGLSIQKKFIPSIANTIGTDMSTYRIIERNQFAYGPVTSRNGDKITIALFNEYDKALISQAYIPFEVKDNSELDPEYLMMWFCRPEFDRYARFKSHGSAREIFDWTEMCNTLLPVPSIERQREIVKGYNVIQNRIALNHQLIQKLEETTQAIYKQWFVDGIDKSNLPEGWRVGNLTNIAIYLNGMAMQKFPATNHEFLPVLKIRELTQGYFDEKSDKGSIETPKEYVIENGDVIFSWSGTLKVEVWTGGKGALNQHLFKVYSKTYPKWFYYLWTKFHLAEFNRIAEGKATSLGHIKREHLLEAQVLIPTNQKLSFMTKTIKPIFDLLERTLLENQKLSELKDLLLSRLSQN